MITLGPLKIVTAEALEGVNALLPQLSPSAKKLSASELKKILEDDHALLLVAKDGGRIIGMATIVFLRTPTWYSARIDDVVVSEQYRGKGLGGKLMLRLIEFARKRKTAYIELTSRPVRVAANNLYKRLGFAKRETNVYRLML